METLKAFILGMVTMGLLMAFVWVSNEAYHQDIRAKANRDKHKEMNWYRVRPSQKEINKG